MNDIRICIPSGAMGASPNDTKLDTFLREFAKKHCDPVKEWGEKYGTDYEDDKARMHCYCWCEKDDCGYCNETEPNFWYKPLDFKVFWYKYIGRGTETNKNLSKKQFKNMMEALNV